MFRQGEELKSLIFLNDDVIAVGSSCDRIVVSYEGGQSAQVPWFEVYNDGKLTSKWNGAMVQGVGFVEYKPDMAS